MFGKATLMSKEVLIRSGGYMSATVSCSPSCRDRPRIALQRLADMWGSRWGRRRRRRVVQTILSSVTAQTVGRHLSGMAHGPFL